MRGGGKVEAVSISKVSRCRGREGEEGEGEGKLSERVLERGGDSSETASFDIGAATGAVQRYRGCGQDESAHRSSGRRRR